MDEKSWRRGALRFFEGVGFFAVAVKFSEEFGDGLGPKAAEDFVIFFGANAVINNVRSSCFGGDTVAHEGLRDESEGALFPAQLFPGVPVAVALKMRFEYVFWTVFGDKSDGRTADGIAEFKNKTFCMAGF